MYKVEIEYGVTILYYNDEVIGDLLNYDGIKELINTIPVEEFYLSSNKKKRRITKEQAMIAYDKILNHEVVARKK